MLKGNHSLVGIMGFIRKLLTGVSSAALVLIGGAGITKVAGAEDGSLHIVIRPPTATDTLRRFVDRLDGDFSAARIEPVIVEIFAGVTVDRIEELATFAREIRDLELDPVAEVVAIETMLALVPLLPRTMISEQAANEVAGQIFDEFVSGGPFLQSNTATNTVGTSSSQNLLFAPLEIELEPDGYAG